MSDAANANLNEGFADPEAPQPPGEGPRTVVGNRIDFSASLDSFQGPLDLLLYLIKENEVEITEIPIATLLDQYLKFMDQAGNWDLQLAGEFLVMAVTLMEIKSRDLLPVQEAAEDGEEIIEDPRNELVRQLLEYRRLKDQARGLELLLDWWQCHHPRGMADEIAEPSNEQDIEAGRALAREALVNVDLYGIFASYEKLMKAVLAQQPRNIVPDTESIEDRVTRIERALKVNPSTRFVDLVLDPFNRADIAATFFALLELVRRRAVRLVQHNEFGSFDVRAKNEDEDALETQREIEAAEAAEQDALRVKAEQDALAAQGLGGEPGKFQFHRKRGPARPKFEGIVRPEDVEESGTEELEIGRRIDAILAAADAISERFEQSREGRVREEGSPENAEAAPPPENEPPKQTPAEPEKAS